MLQVRKWPNVILHLDADAFFASVAQAINPKLTGQPVVTGNERGIATSVSYEAKKLGIQRTTPIFEIKRKYPSCIVVDSDYNLYSLFSQKIFVILKSFSPTVEEYSIDEGFADLKGLRRPLNMGYRQIGQAIKKRVENSLGITVSIGISLTKTLSKIASSFRRPSGLTLIDGLNIENFLRLTKIENVWGIGENTSSYLKKLGIKTALDFALKSDQFVRNNLTKPFFEIWRELRGEKVYELDTSQKQTYKSITRSQTFTPPTTNPTLLWARLLEHVEKAFETARRFDYQVGKIHLFLKTQDFKYWVTEVKLREKTNLPLLIRKELKEAFKAIYDPRFVYRTTGCTISDLKDSHIQQPTLFVEDKKIEKAKKIYPLLETGKVDFGTKLYDS